MSAAGCPPSVSLYISVCVFEGEKRGERNNGHLTLCFSAAGLLLTVGTTINLMRNSPYSAHTHVHTHVHTRTAQCSHARGDPPTYVVILCLYLESTQVENVDRKVDLIQK